jgi:hypothetical protein
MSDSTSAHLIYHKIRLTANAVPAQPLTEQFMSWRCGVITAAGRMPGFGAIRPGFHG